MVVNMAQKRDAKGRFLPDTRKQAMLENLRFVFENYAKSGQVNDEQSDRLTEMSDLAIKKLSKMSSTRLQNWNLENAFNIADIFKYREEGLDYTLFYHVMDSLGIDTSDIKESIESLPSEYEMEEDMQEEIQERMDEFVDAELMEALDKKMRSSAKKGKQKVRQNSKNKIDEFDAKWNKLVNAPGKAKITKQVSERSMRAMKQARDARGRFTKH